MALRTRLFWINEDSRAAFALKGPWGIRTATIAKRSDGGSRILGSDGFTEALDALECAAKSIDEIVYVEHSSRYSFGIVNVPCGRRKSIACTLAENQFKAASRIDEKEHIISSRIVKSDGLTSSHLVCSIEVMDIDSAFIISKRHKIKITGIYCGIDAAICAYIKSSSETTKAHGAIALDSGYSYSVAVMHEGKPVVAFRTKKSEYARAAEKIREALLSCSGEALEELVILSGEGDFFAEHITSGARIRVDNLIVSGKVQEYIMEGIQMG
ncbi:MAG: hypothetical protein GT589_09000 [Peptoclostridium sp.]|uniref:hypothetical protein n=1 Tax=Peptoclostridium sp. TaxID=1904860 RepID=UPI00139DADFB|nr:hypothetical protein [Peptoclostridium sp.]MZQ76270.1 hypothetical protein [Peptoclostridium sp.]